MKVPFRSVALVAVVTLITAPSKLFAADKALLGNHLAATHPVTFEVYIPIQQRDQLERDLAAMHNPASPSYRKWLTPEEFHARYGATDKQLSDIKEELVSKGLAADIVNGHHLHVSGPAAAVEQTLSTHLVEATYANGRSMAAATEAVTPPDALARVGAKVVGLSNRPPMKTHAQRKAIPANRYSKEGSYWFDDLKQAYGFPSYQSLTGKGVTVATLTDGALVGNDMKLYFVLEKMKIPTFSEVNVDGGSPVNDDSFETNLDLQQAGGMAPDAKLIHYNLPDLSDNSFIDGLSQIVTDNKADIVSLSFGSPELLYTAEYNSGVDYSYLVQIEDDLMAEGNAQGITFVASSGDTGALTVPPIACLSGGDHCGVLRASVIFPASSPHVTAVGGTNLLTTYDGTTRNSAYVREQAFGDPSPDLDFGTSAAGGYWGSGGGDSIFFKKPAPQNFFDTGNAKFRTVPDLALHMGGCPMAAYSCSPEDSSDLEYFKGTLYGVIGTSAAAPDFAGLAALGVERFKTRLGNVNYQVYAMAYLQSIGGPVKPFKKGIPGFNGLYSTSSKFYNRVIGLGTINGTEILLGPDLPKAGVPRSPSNP